MEPQQGPPQPDILIGQTVGNYLVTQKLGEGGMGSVYLAEHPTIGKKVALKVLHPEYSNNEEVAQRFFHEAKAVNNIGHPNIVDIVDYGVIQAAGGRDQLVYFIMEYLAGATLSQVIRSESPLPPERAIGIALQVADALAASHRCGIVHRDLKPDNIMLQQRGRERDFVKLLDFGIAKLNDTAGGQRTRTGLIMGTPAYMSPEQCEGRGNVDHRTDIYALGIVLYEMLAGRVPFVGEGYGEVLIQHLSQVPVPPSQYRMLPPHVEAVVLKALEKRAELRYPNMEEMMRALADPVGYVEANGGITGFLQRQLMPSSAPLPAVRLTGSLTPPPGTVTPPSGIYGTPGPTTLGGATGEVQPRRGKAGFLLAGAGILAAAGIAIAIVLSGGGGGSSGEAASGGSAQDDQGSASGSGSDTTHATGSDSAVVPDQGSANPDPDPGTSGNAVTAGTDAGAGSATTSDNRGGDQAGSNAGAPEAPARSVITLTSRPPGAAIFVDDVDTGKKTPEPIEVERARGAVKITLKLDKYDDLVLRNFSVAENVEKTVRLKKKAVANPSSGRGSSAGRGNGGGSTRRDDTGLLNPDDL